MVAKIGGTTIDEATRRMMAFLMENELARQYNFVGHHGKHEFRGLKLSEVVYGVFTFHDQGSNQHLFVIVYIC